MTDAAEPPPDDAKARAAYYRARAFEVRKRAVAISWIGLRSSFPQIAVAYDVLAREAEAASGGVLAQQVEGASPMHPTSRGRRLRGAERRDRNRQGRWRGSQWAWHQALPWTLRGWTPSCRA
jgi:hypothetical protein